MNIYIYGNTSFVNKINQVLDHGNIRLKIDDGVIENISTISQLKNLIEEDPYQIFLIDENKVISDSFIDKYLKFLNPKDGITKKYLDENGVGDISLRGYDDLNIYLSKRLESAQQKRPKATEIKSIDDIYEAFEYDE